MVPTADHKSAGACPLHPRWVPWHCMNWGLPSPPHPRAEGLERLGVICQETGWEPDPGFTPGLLTVATTQPGHRKGWPGSEGQRGSVPRRLEEASPWGWWQRHCFWCYSSGAAERGREAIRERMRAHTPSSRRGRPRGALGAGPRRRLGQGANHCPLGRAGALP